MLCMVATLLAGFSAFQSDLLDLQHLSGGDIRAADGGWVKACDGHADECVGYVASGDSHVDGLGLHHHHYGSEAPSEPIVHANSNFVVSVASIMVLRPGAATPLADHTASTPYQPPRV